MLSGEGGKGDLDAAVVHWCQWMEWNNKGPVRLMRFDHGSEVIRHGEITAKFQVIAAKYHFTIVTSAPDDQATNPQEREYQTVSRRILGCCVSWAQRRIPRAQVRCLVTVRKHLGQ